ncbi:MAG TPA: hypothetical protein VM901_12470 [Bdellovibrionota bacterium]|jgi:hypothetical protein|nr:hypothetical protein [Bdellovibrionota bacterium]
MLRVLATLILVGSFAGCSVFDSQSSRGAYERYVWSKLQDKSLVAEGTSLINVRWFVMRKEYFDQRRAVLGFEDSLGAEFTANQRPLVLVALQMKPSASYGKSDFRVFWNETELTQVREIASVLELRSLYSFAYPFHRLFLYQLPQGTDDGGLSSETLGKLSILSPWGRIEDQERN